MNSLLSIIVPVYKTEDYLKKCVESIINQTYTELEIILVDDGSPDNCGKIVDDYAKTDSRIIAVHKENGGLSSARNSGLDICHGQYIMFVDSDDYIEPDMCQKLYRAVSDNNCDMGVCSIKNVDENYNAICALNDESTVKNELITPLDYYKKLVEDGYWYWVVAWNKIYKREVFKDIRYPNGKLHEDEFVIHHIVSNCSKIVSISDRLYCYFQRGNSITQKAYSVQRLDAIEGFLDRTEFYIKNTIDNDVILKNYMWCIRNMGNTYLKSDYKDAKFLNRYKELYKEYRKLCKCIVKLNIPAFYKFYFVLNSYFPRASWNGERHLRRLIELVYKK